VGGASPTPPTASSTRVESFHGAGAARAGRRSVAFATTISLVVDAREDGMSRGNDTFTTGFGIVSGDARRRPLLYKGGKWSVVDTFPTGFGIVSGDEKR